MVHFSICAPGVGPWSAFFCLKSLSVAECPAMTTTVEFKVGTTFRAPLTYAPTAGLAPTNLANVTITSQIRTQEDQIIATLAAAKDPGNLAFTLTCADTTSWPADVTVYWDIKMVDTADGFGTFYSETVEVNLVRQITK